jgi:hypothetical protein
MEYKKNCPKCNKEIIFNNKYNLQRSIRNNSPCRSCNCAVFNKSLDTSKNKNTQWKGYKEIPYSWFSRYFKRISKKSKRVGNITIEDVYNMWIDQNKKCKLSNVDIGFYDDNKTHTCSIDRIDSLKEYTLDNIQLVHKDVNYMKNRYSQNYFINMCKLIAKNNE